MARSDLPVGTELRTAHGTRWVKTGPNEWRARAEWGVLDMSTLYTDQDVHGEVVNP